jgi:hypothetical protein
MSSCTYILKNLPKAAFGAVFMVSFATSANATSLSIANSDFELTSAIYSPVDVKGLDGTTQVQYFTTNNSVPDWTVDTTNGLAGVFDSVDSYNGLTGSKGGFFTNNAIPSGIQTAYSNGGYLFQQLADSIAANTAYSLKIDVGQRLDVPMLDFNVELLAGNTVLASATKNNLSSPLTAGQFEQLTLNYNAPSNLTSSLLGQKLGILLSSTGPQTNFDNVRLDAYIIPTTGGNPDPSGGTSVPEPSPTLGLLGFAILSSSSLLRRQLRSKKVNSPL